MATKCPGTYKKKDGGWVCRVYFAKDPDTGQFPTPRTKDYRGKTQREAWDKAQADTAGRTVKRARETKSAILRDSLTLDEYIKNQYISIRELEVEDNGLDWSRFSAFKSRLERLILNPETPNLKKCPMRHTKIVVLTPDMVKVFFRAAAADKIPHSTRKEIRGELRAIFREVSRQLPDDWRDYTDQIELKAPMRPEPAIFDDADIFRAITDTNLPLVDRTIVAFEFLTMCRPSEMWALKWDDIKFKNAEVTISKRMRRVEGGGYAERAGTKPGAASKVVPLHPLLLEMLTQLRKVHSQYVFETAQGRQINNYSFQKRIWPRIKRNLKLPDGVRFYALKHTGNSHLAANGVDASARAELMGHRDERMANRTYRRVVSSEARAAVGKFAIPMKPDSPDTT